MLSNELTIYIEDEAIFKTEYVDFDPASDVVEKIRNHFRDYDAVEIEQSRQMVDTTKDDDGHKKHDYGAEKLKITLSIDDQEIARKDVSIPVSDIN